MTSRPVHHTRRPPVRRYRRCRCPRNRSPIVDTAHTPVIRWVLTANALIAFAAGLGIPFLIVAGLAALAWRHR